MKYGKRLRNEVEKTLPEWKAQFICYKQLKKQLKLINPWSRSKMVQNQLSRLTSRGLLDVGFTRLLDSELDKVNTFYFDKEEDYIIRIKELQIRVGNLENEEEKKMELQNHLLEFHAEMLLLLHYSVLNFIGLVKIVKKHNKRTGTSLEFSSMPRVMQESFFSTDLLYKLMTDCEAMLGRLFN
ncbi:hypothetical protein Tsubulata_044563 [Turnera subulata]|uniref:SPX domain-containing protein n=1 Tax=Turnera subulata TaxID=218843 RepID=A0A9Q0F974_9ROSI|nr:hypothetical protein Tsubulata_044563 [Turnera subulata]